MFSRISELDSLAAVTPSLVTVGAPNFVDDDVAALGTEGDLHGLGELIDAALQSGARVNVEMEFFGCHGA